MIQVHETAVVHPSSDLAEGVSVGPYAVIEANCQIGRGTRIGAHVVVGAYTAIGRECVLHPGAVVGGISQDRKFSGGISYCVLGDRNVIREHVTINRATARGESTRIGNDNLLMAGVHVAHDCLIGHDCVLANGVTLAGHVTVEDHVVIGGMSGLHQFIRVGRMAMIGAMSRLAQDVPPFMLCEGNPPRIFGPNVVGLRRHQVPASARADLKRAFRALFREQRTVSQALAEIARLPAGPELVHLVDFIQSSQRGICGIARGDAGLEADD
ncbi:MAG: acyl-ACP--UDP-N-acetylglucosamine O-acyltransferase [Candidatus Sericytochromatia bacterium]|nr:acyl-ACP--UDP-N-acetylglucosamine O-acyltransferase [Candidatus Sericytochromatia bacterium]